MSGPAGALGQDQYDAFMLGIEHAGGKLGGQAVQVIREDDQLRSMTRAVLDPVVDFARWMLED